MNIPSVGSHTILDNLKDKQIIFDTIPQSHLKALNTIKLDE